MNNSIFLVSLILSEVNNFITVICCICNNWLMLLDHELEQLSVLSPSAAWWQEISVHTYGSPIFDCSLFCPKQGKGTGRPPVTNNLGRKPAATIHAKVVAGNLSLWKCWKECPHFATFFHICNIFHVIIFSLEAIFIILWFHYTNFGSCFLIQICK
jgi:hypothetical protein